MKTIYKFFDLLKKNYGILAITTLIIIIRVYLFSTEIHAQKIMEMSQTPTIENDSKETYDIPNIWNFIKNNKDDFILLGFFIVYVTLTSTLLELPPPPPKSP